MLQAVKNLRLKWFTFLDNQDQAETPFTVLFSLQIVCVLLFYVFTHKVLFKLTSLPDEAYFQSVLCVGFFQELVTAPYLLVAGIIGALFFFKRLWVSWQQFENGTLLRNLIVFLGFLLAWRNAFYPYNYFLDQAHIVDRAVLLLMAVLMFWRPIFVLPFLAILLVIIGQFKLLTGYSLADSLMVIQILVMFIAFQLYWLISKQFSYVNFLFMTGCIIASNYFFSGVNKVNYEWIFVDRVGNLLVQSYAIGWNRFLGPEGIRQLIGLMLIANPVAKVLTLTVELGILFFFSRVQWIRILLITAIVFHVGIFFSSGICFWLWSAMHLFFLVFVWREGQGYALDRLFNRRRAVVAAAIIATASLWSNPVVLYWLDIPIQSVSRLHATCKSGETYELSPDFFGENDFNFTFQDFQFLRAAPDVRRFANSDSSEIFYFFNQERTDDEILQFESQSGTTNVSAAAKQKFENYVRLYINSYNNRSQSDAWLRFLRPPDILWQATGVRDLPAGETIEKVSLRSTTHYFSQQSGPRIVRDEWVADIELNPLIERTQR